MRVTLNEQSCRLGVTLGYQTALLMTELCNEKLRIERTTYSDEQRRIEMRRVVRRWRRRNQAVMARLLKAVSE